LKAGDRFVLSDRSLYTRTLVAHCIDEYARLRRESSAAAEGGGEADAALAPAAALEPLVNAVVERCASQCDWKSLVGLAVELNRLELVDRAFERCADRERLLVFCYDISMRVSMRTTVCHELLRRLVATYRRYGLTDWFRMCTILTYLGDVDAVHDMLVQLASSAVERDTLIAYQIAFDLVDNAPQRFRLAVRTSLGVAADAPAPDAGSAAHHLRKLDEILSGKISIGLQLQFLHRCNRADPLLLSNIRAASESHGSLNYAGVVLCNAYMNAGTTRDSFLRENLTWLAHATNWSRFIATASIGVIQQGHWNKSMTILEPYLPTPGFSGSPYSAGGALFALGLINANISEECAGYLRRALRDYRANEVLVHGACLGLGVAAMGTRDPDIMNELMAMIYDDNAVVGEAAAIALGLVMLGSASPEIETLLEYTHHTEHEKIVRGVAMCVALMMYQTGEDADALIEQLCSDANPLLRYGGMYTVAMAYAGTANNSAIRRLLHTAVSDVSDDVRMAAVIGLGFLLFNQPGDLPMLLTDMVTSYNYHVRYGACIALGIACAGTASRAAIDLLSPLKNDPSGVVTQGAFIGLSMILQQTSTKQNAEVDTFRKTLMDSITNVREDPMVRFGAQLASGILDAGGRNCVVGLHTRTGHHNVLGVVGAALFCQYWYWHPMGLFLSLAFQSTAVIGLNRDLKMPQFSFRSNAPPSMFDYPPALQTEVKKVAQTVVTAELSITKKAKKRAQERGRASGDGTSSLRSSVMDVEAAPASSAASSSSAAAAAAAAAPAAADGSSVAAAAAATPAAEPAFLILSNPSRVTVLQRSAISYNANARYRPLKSAADAIGIVMLEDTTPDVAEVLIDVGADTTAPAPVPTATTPTAVLATPDNEMLVEDAAPPSFDFDPTLE
jgi:26S proteasome regulatory subunit N2